MRQVIPSISTVQKILGDQKTVIGGLYRLSTHCMRMEQPDGILLYHTLTGELLLLSHEEAALLGALPGPISPVLRELVPRWFLRPEGADDMALADQTRQIAECLKKKETALTKYAIFTTTACNARCFYCFEAGWEKRSMTEQTARDTAKYIAGHCNGREVHLKWFGGEPLVNAKVIDIITDCLRRQGVEFHSTMISNGYLFDETLARRARDAWNMDQVQITLDGTEEIYNRRKAYANPHGSPFQQVLRNIGLLLDVGIQVNIRLNMDKDNERDLYALIDELAERFAGKAGFGVYSMVILENVGHSSAHYTEEERYFYAQKRRSVRAYMQQKGIALQVSLNRGITVNACLADSDRFTTVTPEGRLGRCETCKDGAIWGSIYSDEVNEAVIRQWKERKPSEMICKSCAVYPQCARLKKCPIWLEHCSPIERSVHEEILYGAILGTYEDWKASGQI